MKKLFLYIFLVLMFCSSAFAQNYNPKIPIWDQYSKITCRTKITYSYKDGKMFGPAESKYMQEIDFNKGMVFHKLIENNEIVDLPINNKKIIDKYFYYVGGNVDPINTIYLGRGIVINFFVTKNKISSIGTNTFSQKVFISHADCL